MDTNNRVTENNAGEPSTETAGCERSELLGTRHSLTGQVAIQPGEEMQAYDIFIREMVQAFAPETIVERQLAQSYATYQWRINRSAAIEETTFTLGNMEQIAENLNIRHPQAHNAATNAKTFREHSDMFNRISLYSQRLIHQSETVLKRLQQIQAERKQHQQQDLVEAARIYRLHEMHAVEFDPTAHGFGSTVLQVKTFVRLQTLHTQAVKAEKLGWRLQEFTETVGKFAA